MVLGDFIPAGVDRSSVLSSLQRITQPLTDFIRGNVIVSTAAVGIGITGLVAAATTIRRRKKKKAKRKAKKRRVKKRRVSKRRKKKVTHRSPRHKGHKRVSFIAKNGKRVSFLVKKKAHSHKKVRRRKRR